MKYEKYSYIAKRGEMMAEKNEVIESLKEYVLKVMRESHNANPQEIAILPELIRILGNHYKEF